MELVLAAVVTGGFGLIGILVNRSAKRVTQLNTQEHEFNKVVLERIESKVDGISEDLTDHLSWHLRKTSKKDSAA